MTAISLQSEALSTTFASAVSIDFGHCDTAPDTGPSRGFPLRKRPQRCDNSDIGCRDFPAGSVQDGRSAGALLRPFGSNGGSAWR